MDDERPRDLAQEAEGRSRGPLGEFASFLRATGKWWLAPVIVALLMIGALLIVSGTAVGPLIYTLF